MSKYDELVDKLKEIFELKDTAELDFGIYRILHARADKIKDFLENRLQEKVREQLSGNAAAQVESLKMELQKARANAESLGIENVDATPKVQELKAKLAQFGNHDQTENDVYSHLLTFFGRYYEKGDFISKRRYKGDTYAIPYSGEEVKLHWANADQYYIKSSEHFSNYTFTLANGKKVHFIMVQAALPSDNQKDNEAKHRYVLWNPADAPSVDETADEEQEAQACYPDKTMEIKEGELCIYFRYARLSKAPKQVNLNDDIEKAVLETMAGDGAINADFYELSATLKTSARDTKTILRRHLDAYVARNTMDYFIHKDLKGFLSRELDFYIKNEIMNLDDIQDSSSTEQLERSLKLIQVFRSIAKDLIDFMAHLEDFQKRLWLKKKFVVECEYCITMDRVPEDLRGIVLSNQKQMQEWERLGTAQEPTSGVDARMVDTKFFDAQFKSDLLSSLDGIDDICGGLIIHSDNAAALRLLNSKYQSSITAIYIDPPYNTGNDGFLYKDSYQHSSWLSMMQERLSLGRSFATNSCAILASVDENEITNLHKAFDVTWGTENHIADFIWAGGRKNDSKLVSVSHEYMVCYARAKSFLETNKIKWRQRKKGLDDIYSVYNKLSKIHKKDYARISEEMKKWYKSLPASNFAKAHKQYSCADERGLFFPSDISWPGGGGPRYEVLHPVTHKPVAVPARGWVYADPQSMQNAINSNLVVFGEDEKKVPCKKSYLKDNEYAAPNSVIYQDGRAATKRLGNILGAQEFGYPKDEDIIAETLSSWVNSTDTIMDYFAGSGTTGHAVISLNREDGGKRRYILVEVGDHCDNVILPRIKKIVYSPNWKNGTPKSFDQGISHCFKYMSLESYEDTLNNLQLKQPGEVPSLLHDEYLLRYMLEFESKGSFINTDSFRKPFDYKLQVTIDSSGATEERKVDLPETFNYLIGLTVTSYDRHIDKGYMIVEGTLPNGDRTLVIWRDVDKLDSQQLNNLLDKLGIHPGNSEYKCIYVNGDHAISTRKPGGDDVVPALKVRLIEEDFLRLMFNEEA